LKSFLVISPLREIFSMHRHFYDKPYPAPFYNASEHADSSLFPLVALRDHLLPQHSQKHGSTNALVRAILDQHSLRPQTQAGLAILAN